MEKDYILVEFNIKGKKLVQKMELGVETDDEGKVVGNIPFGEGWEMMKRQVELEMFPKLVEELRK